MNRFDHEWRLPELLGPDAAGRLAAALGGLLGAPAALTDGAGVPVAGLPDPTGRRQALVLELEPIGYLVAVAPGPALEAAAGLVEDLLRAEVRYRMASSLHLESVAADYEQLKQQHAHVLESEARYKALSAELEQRVAAQVARLEEQQRLLYQAEKLASVGQLAAGIAHEINNPIGFIRSNLNSFRGYLGKFAELKAGLASGAAAWSALDLDFVLSDGAELLDECIGGLDRVARIVRDLKGFSNIDRPEEEMADMNDNLRDVAGIATPRLPPEVGLRLDLEPALPRLLCLPGHLNQVFLNLIDNGVQAVVDKGGAGQVVVASRAEPGAVVISVSDDGVGMDRDQLGRAFDPFYTTRPVGSGTGLGLSVARDIINAHGGSIQLDSEPGRGTTATVRLPL